MRHSIIRRKTSRRRGVVLIEFCAAFFCIFLPLCMALLQYGMIIQATSAMNNISREAGRYASVTSLTANDDTALKTYITTNAAGMGITVNTADVTVSPAPNTTTRTTNRVRYSPITINISYSMSQKSFLQAPFTAIFHIPIFRSTYTTNVVMVMQ